MIVPEDAKIGICVHELGHKCKPEALSASPHLARNILTSVVFGWPDLYDKVGISQILSWPGPS